MPTITKRKVVVAVVVLCALGFLVLRKYNPWATAGSNRAELPGLGAAFDAELKKIGQLSPQEFSSRYATKSGYQDTFNWDPTQAQFWDQITAAPTKERFDFRPNAEEIALFKKNGFMVSERLGASNPTEMYYRIYARDLPVFITSDSVLHAWHKSYDAILEDLETNALSPVLESMLAEMASQIPEATKEYGQGVLQNSLKDADFFIGVARALLNKGYQGTKLNQDARVQAAVKAADALQIKSFDLFGRGRDVDFSQFQPRGHYVKSQVLKDYFRAMMWCGRIDFRIAGNDASPRELGGAIVLHDLLRRSAKIEQWQHFDDVLQAFIGKSDSMTFAQMSHLLAKADIKSAADVQSLDALTALQKQILAGKFGLQQICGDLFCPDGIVKTELPRSFAVLGQRFTIDSWALSKVVYDDIEWDGSRVNRRIPSCLDVAFAALGNDHVVPELTARMQNKSGHTSRDGLNYQHNLAAARNVLDSLKPDAWEENLYMAWLGSLRELSKPTTDSKVPEAMRSRAWAMKTLNTQLASWTQLRHDTVLYVKQSYTAGNVCYFPAGHVEPVAEFWGRMEKMAERAAELFRKVYLSSTPRRYTDFLDRFAKTMGTLKHIAIKELEQRDLTASETKFLEDVVELSRDCGGPLYFTGWYPMLYFDSSNKGLGWDALVADVHTNPPSLFDSGCVLHQGVGNFDLMLIAIDSGKGRIVYAGPVLSHYEFEMPGVNRKTDSEWQMDINVGKTPPRPEWTRGYLAPGVNPEAKNYRVE